VASAAFAARGKIRTASNTARKRKATTDKQNDY